METLGKIELPLVGVSLITNDEEGILDILFDINSPGITDLLSQMHSRNTPQTMAASNDDAFAVMFFWPHKFWSKDSTQKYALLIAPNVMALGKYLNDLLKRSRDQEESDQISHVIAFIQRIIHSGHSHRPNSPNVNISYS